MGRRIDLKQPWGCFKLCGARRFATRAKLAAASLSNQEVLTSVVSRYKKPVRKTGFLYLVHSGGFEPPTARFVAGYSIQLSYECKKSLLETAGTIGEHWV